MNMRHTRVWNWLWNELVSLETIALETQAFKIRAFEGISSVLDAKQ